MFVKKIFNVKYKENRSVPGVGRTVLFLIEEEYLWKSVIKL